MFAQNVVEHSPLFPSADQSITITFYADRGSQGLRDHNGDIYAHTGVITDNSVRPSDWKYVKTGWGQNTSETKMVRKNTNQYELTINNIREYYGVPLQEKIVKLAFVFRSADTSKEGKDSGGSDIFISLFEQSINLALISPNISYLDPFITSTDTTVSILAKASSIGSTLTSLQLFINETVVATTKEDSILYPINLHKPGIQQVDIIALDELGRSDTLSFQLAYNALVQLQPLPQSTVDGINYHDNGSVTLVLHAPNKDFGYIIGDFNDWKVDPNYFMHKANSGLDERWWITIDNLSSMKEYAFQYLINGDLRIADPYAEKILDPMNDSSIPRNVYPNPMPYPHGKTKHSASVLQTGQINFQWESVNYMTPNKNNLIIYEMLVRDFVEDHHYLTLIDSLDYLQNLGINAIELMPINEFEGNNSWGYNPSFLFAPDKFYGTREHLKEFIDACHKRGIAVLMDLVINHSYASSPFVRLYTDGKPTEENPWFNREHNFANTSAHWGNDWDHESKFTQEIFKRAIAHWMQQYKIDGFRFDFTKGIGNNYKPQTDSWGSLYDEDRIKLLKQIAENVWANNSNGIVIMEHLAEDKEDRELAEHGILLWANANYNYGEAIMGYNGGNSSSLSWTYFKNRGWKYPHMVTYMESHDEERVMYKALNYGDHTGSHNVKNLNVALERLKSAGALFFLTPGPKMIWQFGELGYDYSIDYNGRLGKKPIKWDYLQDLKRKNLYNTWSYLINLKNKFPIFSDPNSSIDTWLNGSVKKMKFTFEEKNAMVIANFATTAQKNQIDLPHNGPWYHATLGNEILFDNNSIEISIPPGTFMLLTDFEIDYLPLGQAKLSINQGLAPQAMRLHPNYPNPFNPITTIQLDIISEIKLPVTLLVYDIQGREIDQIFDGFLEAGRHAMDWNANDFSSGIYFLKFKAGNYQQIQKMILTK